MDKESLANLTKAILAFLAEMTEDQRLEFLGAITTEFCQHCGSQQTDGQRCQCWNDE